jgi:hypothetical protein
MPAALNNFRTTLANVTATTANIYTPPAGYSTVVLMAQISNHGNATINITANVYRASLGTSFALVNNLPVPNNDAASVLTGRLILQVGDTFQITSSDNTSGQLVLSYLETLVTGA